MICLLYLESNYCIIYNHRDSKLLLKTNSLPKLSHYHLNFLHLKFLFMEYAQTVFDCIIFILFDLMLHLKVKEIHDCVMFFSKGGR
jgi:hypothetical protein